MTETQASIVSIGEEAVAGDDPLVILFGEGATDALKRVALVQRFEDPTAQAELTLKPGDAVRIDDTPYTIQAVGHLANANLQSLGHAALVFSPVPAEDMLQSALYLTPTKRPRFEVGTTLTYVSAE